MTLVKKSIADYNKRARTLCGKNKLLELNTIVVSVEDDKLHLACIDLHYYFNAAIPFINDSFVIDSFTFPKTLFYAYTIFEAVTACKGKHIEVSLREGKLYFNDIMLPVSDIDYSNFPVDKFLEYEITSKGTVHKMDTFERSFSFISDDDMWYFMGGVHIKVKDGQIRFESTDGRAALQSDYTMGITTYGKDVDYILRDVSKFIPLEMIRFKTTDKMIEYHNDMYRLAVDHIDGQFPNIDRVMPDIRDYKKVIFDRKDFLEAVEKLTVSLKMKGSFKPSLVSVFVTADRIATHSENVYVKTGFDADEEICFSLVYLTKILKRNHDFDFLIKEENAHDRAVMVIDPIFETTEITMPKQKG